MREQALTLLQHDAVLDYYGRRLATCSSDKTIKIFEVDGDQHRLTETLKGFVIVPIDEPGWTVVDTVAGMTVRSGV
jgi:hypothetical protein